MSLFAWTLAAVLSLPIYHEDRNEPHKTAQLAMIAAAVADAARNREEAALALTVGYHESAFSYRIHSGRCKPRECDRGLAMGPWQPHKNWRPEEFWRSFGTFQGTADAAREAVKDLRWARGVCRGEPDEIIATFRAYGGRGCRGRLPDEAARLATFRRLVAR